MPNTIAENLQRLVDAKNDIADAIVAKGGTVNEGDGLEEFPADIATIPVGGDSHFATNLIVTTEPGAVVTATRVSIQLNVKAESEAPITITDGFTTLTGTGTGDWQVFWLPNAGTWTVSSTVSGENISAAVPIYDNKIHTLDISTIGIYGATWSGGSSSVFTRTDDSAEFSNPDPYVADGNHPGSSPFDNIRPWSDMKITIIDGNSLVAIPKYWYKITRSGSAMTFQIANYPAEGFKVSPAHQDRGDGAGERDVVYIGRYHCASDYRSKTGVMPAGSITRAEARYGVATLGRGYYLNDFALFWTIRMLYLVEFANWNCRSVIGVGGGSGSGGSGGSINIMGYTDLMPYHTGTMTSSRTTNDTSTQYRYIEGLWDNVYDWCDGIRIYSSQVYVNTDLLSYSDTIGGTQIGTKPSDGGLITSFCIPSDSNLDWAMFPSTTTTSGGSYTTYISHTYTSGSTTNVATGDYYSSTHSGGLFKYDCGLAESGHYNYAGARLMYLPPNNS